MKNPNLTNMYLHFLSFLIWTYGLIEHTHRGSEWYKQLVDFVIMALFFFLGLNSLISYIKDLIKEEK